VVDLTLNTRSEADRTVLEVAGEVDVYTGTTLRDRISDLLDGGVRDLVVDLGRVDFIDSTGLGVLVGALNRARELGGSLQLVCAQERVLKLLRITGLDQVFTVQPSVDQALAAGEDAGTDRPAGQPDDAGVAADATGAGSDAGSDAGSGAGSDPGEAATGGGSGTG
jgi:anti-sigma B factor antagonist